jgi:hypothetical protein
MIRISRWWRLVSKEAGRIRTTNKQYPDLDNFSRDFRLAENTKLSLGLRYTLANATIYFQQHFICLGGHCLVP